MCVSASGSLEAYLSAIAERSRLQEAAAATVAALAKAARSIADLVAVVPLLGGLATVVEDEVRGDCQKELDVRTNRIALDALGAAPVAIVGSEEMAEGLVLDPRQPLAVAIDPLDGSSNIETNAPIGTIFSILPTANYGGDLPRALLQPGTAQIVAGFFIYGPQTSLLVSFGEGTQLFTFDPLAGQFMCANTALTTPSETNEYAMNGSNYRHWDESIRNFMDDCLAGATGPHGVDYNTRWLGSLVAEAYRILIRGGVYLYPGDARQGYGDGRLRLLYEANPIAFLMEQADGRATDGRRRILDIRPASLHQRIPLVFGSRRAVECVARYYDLPASRGWRSPLFRHRSVLGG